MVFSADGKSLLLANSEKSISLWNTADGKEVRRFRDLPASAHSLVLSPRGDRIAFIESWTKKSKSGGFSWGTGTRVFLVDSRTGAELRHWSVKPEHSEHGFLENGWWSIAFSPHGCRLAACQKHGPVRVWDTATGEEKQLMPTLRLWELKTGKDRLLFEKGTFYGYHLTLSPDGKTLAVPVNYKDLMLFNAATGKCLHRLTTKTRIVDVAFSADAAVVKALTGDRTVWRWELPSGRRLPDETMPPDREQGPNRITKARKYETTKERQARPAIRHLSCCSLLPFFVFSYFRAFVIPYGRNAYSAALRPSRARSAAE